METEITDIGKVAITPQKDYQNERTYEWLDVVTYDGAGYMCIAEDGCTGIVPTNTDYWQLLADKGHFTEEDKEEFKKAVVEESKTEINEHTGNKKTELNNYTTELEKSLENELDTYKTEKEAQMDLHKATLETEMANKKDSLIEEIETAQNGFDANAEEKTNTFNSNVETKTTEFNNNSNAKTEEFNNNSTEKINAFNSNAEEKIAEYDAHAEKLTNRIADLEEENSELAQQMPWNTTEIQESIYVADSARYSKNKLSLFGNMAQETREGYNLLDISNIQTQEKYGVTITNNGDGTLTFNGTSTSNFGINTEIEPKTLLAGNYTKSIPRDTNIKTGLTISLGTVSGGAIPKTTLQPSTGTATFELEEDSTYNQLRMYIGSGTIFNNYVLKWMIVKGTYTSETIPPFEQYGAMPSIEYPSMPVVTTGLQTVKKYSKNLCKRFINGSTYRYSAAFYLDCNLEKGKYYALSFTDLSVGNVYYRNENVTGANGEYSSYTITSTGKRQTWIFLCKENNKNMGGLYFKDRGYYFLKNNKQQEQPSNLVDVQLEEVTSLSSLATSYEPYIGEDIALDLGTTEVCKITDQDGNVVAQDRAVHREVDGVKKWQWEKKVLKAVINSKTGIKYNGLKNNNTAVDFHSQTLKNLPANVYSPIIEKITRYNYLKPGSTTSTNNFRITVSLANLGLEEFTTPEVAVKALKNLITKKGDAIIYYKATEPIYEDCTVDQSEALEKLYKLQLEKGVNNIFVESKNGVTTELQLEYMQDSNLIQKEEHKALEDRITAIEALLSTTQTSALLLDNMQNDLESEVE